MISQTSHEVIRLSAAGLRVAPALSDQLPAIAELDQTCFGGLWGLDAYQREIDSPNSDLLLLTQGGDPEDSNPEPLSKDGSNPGSSQPGSQLLGMACLWSILEEAHITILAVHPQHRRRGYGRILLIELLTSAYQRGLEWATLEVRPSNQAAVQLYEWLGFETVGRRRRYYQDDGEDALILWHKGLQTPAFQVQLESWRGTFKEFPILLG